MDKTNWISIRQDKQGNESNRIQTRQASTPPNSKEGVRRNMIILSFVSQRRLRFKYDDGNGVKRPSVKDS